MNELHLIQEVKLSEVAGTGKAYPPCSLWALCGPMPDGIEIDEPQPIILPEVQESRHMLYTLTYEDFKKATQGLTPIATDLKSAPQGIPALLAAKALGVLLDYDVYLYETCDY